MNKLLIVILSLIALATSIFLFPLGPGAIFAGGLTATVVVIILSNQSEDKEFLLQIFFIALILRILCALLIYTFNLQEFFGPDALTYEDWGFVLSEYWIGNIAGSFDPSEAFRKGGYGIVYIIGSIYFVLGRNPLAVQFFISVLGASTAPITYFCSKAIFSNKRTSRITAIIVAVFPSLIIWTSQGLKDGIIVFFLVLSILCVLQLQKKFNYFSFLFLMISLFGIISLRFYIFYMLVMAIVGSFAVGKPLNPVSVLRRMVVLLLIGLALTSFGIANRTDRDLSQFNLEKVQQTREDLARGNAGYDKDADVSTTQGALSALPLGLVYLMLAPFPWQMTNLRQAITLPEMIAWWAGMPFLIMGLMYTVRHRLRTSIAVLLFTLMLTVAYSLYQGNVGSAYRQRAQIQIFHFMFIAAGITLWQEKKENKKILRNLNKRRMLRDFRYKENS